MSEISNGYGRKPDASTELEYVAKQASCTALRSWIPEPDRFEIDYLFVHLREHLSNTNSNHEED
ncbi:acyl-CoA dehydrogenase domain-containing protein [Ahrensia sp. R2A130]|nr:acyl-CoA dehydrogenase domain-containing protein [Ahrensia sp. R2A130]